MGDQQRCGWLSQGCQSIIAPVDWRRPANWTHVLHTHIYSATASSLPSVTLKDSIFLHWVIPQTGLFVLHKPDIACSSVNMELVVQKLLKMHKWHVKEMNTTPDFSSHALTLQSSQLNISFSKKLKITVHFVKWQLPLFGRYFQTLMHNNVLTQCKTNTVRCNLDGTHSHKLRNGLKIFFYFAVNWTCFHPDG